MTYLHPIMIISLVIMLVQIILFITRLYKYSIFLIIFSFVLYLIVDDAPIYTTAMILLIIYTIYLIYKIIKHFIIKNKLKSTLINFSFFVGNGTNDVPFFIYRCKIELYTVILLPKNSIFAPSFKF